MNEKEIDEYLKNNLSLDVDKCRASYGGYDYLKIELKLKNETISTIYIDIDE